MKFLARFYSKADDKFVRSVPLDNMASKDEALQKADALCHTLAPHLSAAEAANHAVPEASLYAEIEEVPESEAGFGIPVLWAAVILVSLAATALFAPRSPLHIGKTPIQKQEQAKQNLQVAKDDTGKAAQRAAHETVLAAEFLPASHQKDVVLTFANEGAGLLDQTYGAPAQGDSQLWGKLVTDLEQENAAMRAQGESERAAQAKEVSAISSKLTNYETLYAHSQDAVTEYAKENEAKARLVNWVEFIGAVLIGGWVLCQLSGGAAEINPAFDLASKLLHAVYAPVASMTLAKAKAATDNVLTRVGNALGTLKTEAPLAAAQAVPIFDAVMDEAHQVKISAAADAAHAAELLKKAKAT